jgi:HSP20 family molecular chaperone IbpA
MQLPDRANADDVAAHLEDGILRVIMPLKTLPQPKKIAIESKNSKK